MNRVLYNQVKELVENTFYDEKRVADSADFVDAFNEKFPDCSHVCYLFWHDETDLDNVADVLLDLGRRYKIAEYAVVEESELDLTIVAVKLDNPQFN